MNSTNDLDRAIAAAREALAAADASLQGNAAPSAMLSEHYDACAGCADALRDLLAALDAARGEAVATVMPLVFDGKVEATYIRIDVEVPPGTKLYAAPPAALAVLPEPLPPTPDTMNLTDAQREVEDAFRRGWNSCRATVMQAQQPAALAVPTDNVTPMRQPRADLARLVESINAAVYANGNGLSVTEAIGALELAKLELLKEQEQ